MKARTKIATATAPDGTPIDLWEHDGDHEISIRGAGLMSSRQHFSEEELGRLAVEEIGEKPTVVIGGMGLGFTLRAVLDALPEDARVVQVELCPEIVEWNRGVLAEHAGRPLEDPRVEVVVGDVLEYLEKRNGTVAAVALDVDNGAAAMVSGDNRRLYGPKGLKAMRRALRPKGRLAIWSANEDRDLVQRMRDVGLDVSIVPAHARPNRKGPRHLIFIGNQTNRPARSPRAPRRGGRGRGPR